MESITFTATAIATIIFSKALETSGENLGEAVSHKIGQLLNFIRDKFQQEGVEGKLLKAQEDPSEKNQDRFKRELVDLMEDDENFADQLQTLIEEIKSDAKVNIALLKMVRYSNRNGQTNYEYLSKILENKLSRSLNLNLDMS